MNKLRETIADSWWTIQDALFPWIEDELGSLTQKQQALIEPELAADGFPYRTLGYTNGHGFGFLPIGGDTIYDEPINLDGRANLTAIDTTDQGFHSETLVPLGSETHAAEDVAIYATGPGAYLVNGLMEQNTMYHVMRQASNFDSRR